MPKDGRKDVVQKGLEDVCVCVWGGRVGGGGVGILKIVIAMWRVQFSCGFKFFFLKRGKVKF